MNPVKLLATASEREAWRKAASADGRSLAAWARRLLNAAAATAGFVPDERVGVRPAPK